MVKNIIPFFKNLVKKPDRFSCIIFDGLTMRYQDMTQKEIEIFKNKKEHKDWTLTINDKIQRNS